MYNLRTLDNGIRLLTTFVPHAMSVSTCIYVESGSRHEEDEKAGLSHFLEHMVFKGTPSRPSPLEITGAIEGVGGLMNASTDRELTNYWCKVALPHFADTVDVLVDMLRSPLLSHEEVEKERGVIQEELAMTNDYPDYRVGLLTDQMLWPNQPMGRDVGGTKESVASLSRDMIVDWFRHQYGASSIVISIAGGLSEDEVLSILAPKLKQWPSNSPYSLHPAVNRNSKSYQARLEYRETEQAHLSLSFSGVGRSDPDRFVLDLMCAVLGEGMSSRLFLQVRENLGLVYDIHSSASHYSDTGSIVIDFGVDPGKASLAVETILEELNKIKQGVAEEELHRARELLKGRLLLRMEDTRTLAAWSGAQELLTNKVLSVAEVVDSLDAVQPNDISTIASRFLKRDELNLAVVGPYQDIEPFKLALRQWGSD